MDYCLYITYDPLHEECGTCCYSSRMDYPSDLNATVQYPLSYVFVVATILPLLGIFRRVYGWRALHRDIRHPVQVEHGFSMGSMAEERST